MNIHFIRIFLLLLSTALFPVASHAASILVIESYHGEYQWDKEYKQALNEYLAADHQLHFFEMNTKRLPVNQYQQQADLAWQLFEQLKPDLVILGDDNALKYLGPPLAKTNTPVVYLGINNNPRNYQVTHAKNITGVLERPLIKRSVVSLGSIMPKMRKLLILFDSGNTSHTSLENIFNNESITHISHIEVEIKLIQQWNLWQSQVEMALKNDYDAIVIGLFQTIRDENNTHVNPEKVLAWTSENSPLPLFAFWDFAVGKNKAIGGLVLQGYHQGVEAAQMVLKIFSGIPPSSIVPATATNGSYIFSQSELNRYQIQLPENIYMSTLWVE